ncbi:MAG: tRNA (guanosine(37)-N1)-methyltransferase TrmD [Spirochaetaceae bacterium]|jgi:tRNA (guanine37-N1)-methyltransferase|nr:tRNA (guanosine(37)-N1)-methyltransferase TrmD [Spirochaetaceae bacterium]
MKYQVLTLFPEITDAFFATSIMARAVERGIVEYHAVNIRDFALDKHKTCDDAPYGGGAGMLMLPEPLGRALEAAGARNRLTGSGESCPGKGPRVIYLSPSGRPFTQAYAGELAAEQELILLCGRYEGIDQRIIDAYVDDEISVGDYVLSSGEAAALVVIDATYRLLDQVITPESLAEESFSGGLLEYPQYTRPEIYGMLRVPEVLLSGHHENIRRWRLKKRVEKTLALRPDLIRRGEELGLFDAETRKLIQEAQGET